MYFLLSGNGRMQCTKILSRDKVITLTGIFIGVILFLVAQKKIQSSSSKISFLFSKTMIFESISKTATNTVTNSTYIFMLKRGSIY